MPYRLLLANSHPHLSGGAEVLLLEIATRLPTSEFECLLVTSAEGSLTEEFAARGIESLVVPPGYFQSRSGLREYYLAGRLAFRRILRERRIDLAHVNCDNAIRPVVSSARGVGVPSVVHIHDTARTWFRPKNLRRMNQADRVVVISRTLEADGARHGVRPGLLRLVYNGMDPRPYYEAGSRRAEMRSALGLAEHEVAVGLVGNLRSQKGQQDAIRALAEPALRGVPVRLFLAGGDQGSQPMLERLAADLGVDARVAFLGFRRDIAALMAAFDATVAPFRNEMFGLVVAEAFHSALPTVAYRDGALPEVMRGDVDGLFVEPGDIAGLAEALRRLATDPELRRRLGASARERGTLFTMDSFIAGMRAVYRDVLGAEVVAPPLPAAAG